MRAALFAVGCMPLLGRALAMKELVPPRFLTHIELVPVQTPIQPTAYEASLFLNTRPSHADGNRPVRFVNLDKATPVFG